jgi:putative flippase GtrA
MTAAPEKIARAAWRLVPAPIERKLRTEAGNRFARFAGVAIVAVITSQVVLGLLTGPINLTAGLSGVLASMSAALVSYLLSRWAWERKGRPDLLRETVPFWAVSVAVWIILGLTSRYAYRWAHSHDYTHLEKHLIVQGAFLLMNCVTFVGRFLIFHYVLFAPKKTAKHAGLTPELATADATAHSQDASSVALLTGDSPSQPQARHRA